jgi:hypothetical protein
MASGLDGAWTQEVTDKQMINIKSLLIRKLLFINAILLDPSIDKKPLQGKGFSGGVFCVGNHRLPYVQNGQPDAGI